MHSSKHCNLIGQYSIFNAFKFFLSELRLNRHATFRMFERNYLNRYAGTFLGRFWLIVIPCVPLLVYNTLQWMGIFGNQHNGMPRAISLTIGLTIYYTFSELLQSTTSSILTNRNFIINTGIPKMVILTTELYSVITNFFIRFLVLLISFSLYPDFFSFKIFFLPLIIIPLVVLAFSIGIVNSLVSVLYKDVPNIINITTFYLLFASGVFGRVDTPGPFFDILRASPIHIIINNFRDYVFLSTFNFNWFETATIMFCFVLFPFTILLFYRGEKYVNSHF